MKAFYGGRKGQQTNTFVADMEICAHNKYILNTINRPIRNCNDILNVIRRGYINIDDVISAIKDREEFLFEMFADKLEYDSEGYCEVESRLFVDASVVCFDEGLWEDIRVTKIRKHDDRFCIIGLNSDDYETEIELCDVYQGELNRLREDLMD